MLFLKYCRALYGDQTRGELSWLLRASGLLVTDGTVVFESSRIPLWDLTELYENNHG